MIQQVINTQTNLCVFSGVRYLRMSGRATLGVGRTTRFLVVGCGAAAMLKPWGTRRAESRTPAPRPRLRSRCDQTPSSRPSSDPRTCWTLRGTTQVKSKISTPSCLLNYSLACFCLFTVLRNNLFDNALNFQFCMFVYLFVLSPDILSDTTRVFRHISTVKKSSREGRVRYF